jgi:hypothetical protein
VAAHAVDDAPPPNLHRTLEAAIIARVVILRIRGG